uniref:Secreted protein n=1 Tax=Brassica oleracea var. oleracea TaxID=109376 RepID=A0A0D3BCN7_BRAOL
MSFLNFWRLISCIFPLCIGVPHGVLGDIWVHLELKRGDTGDRWTSSAWGRPYQSDAISSFWSAKIDPERPPRATTRSRSSSRARSAQRHPKVARVCVDLRHEEQAGSNVPQRLPEVAPNT